MKVTLFFIIFSFSASAQVTGKKTIKYEYKKHEKFDFESMGIEGEIDTPGEVSIDPRLKQRFKNKLPERENFNEEIVHSIDGIR